MKKSESINNKKKSRLKAGKKLLITGVLFVSAAFSIIVYNQITEYSALSFTDSVMDNIHDFIDSDNQKSEHNVDSVFSNDQEKDYIYSDANCFEYQNYYFMGYLSIPKLELELPVMADWNYDSLNISPCRYSGSVLTDDFVIAAHNYRSHFGLIGALVPGEEVIYTDLNGRAYKYEVTVTESLKPNETDKMISGEYDLTLFTCTWSGTERIAVRCEKKTEIVKRNLFG